MSTDVDRPAPGRGGLRVAVVGSGVVGAAVALVLGRAGHRVDVFEKGGDFPYPHEQARDELRLGLPLPDHELGRDLRDVTESGTYRPSLRSELVQRVGGMTTSWRGIALRLRPEDLLRRSVSGVGEDWPLDYDELEPWYGRAEALLGVAGTDEDAPGAPWRSTPYPLPPLPLAADDHVLAERLAQDGIVMSTTPQAITSQAYDGRPRCTNIGPTCNTCPTGARYSATHHLDRARATGHVGLHTGTCVRRVLVDSTGRARGLVVQGVDEATEREVPADVVVVAGGAVETARLLLLSADERQPDGLGGGSGHLGQHLTFHHMYSGRLVYDEQLFPGRTGPMTGQLLQFLDPAPDGSRGGVKVELTSHLPSLPGRDRWTSAVDVRDDMQRAVRSRNLGLHAETRPGPRKTVTLSRRKDRFGDPFPHVRYTADDYDRATHAWGRGLAERLARATGAVDLHYRGPDDYTSVYHHLGTTRMSERPSDGVVDPWGAVHGTTGLYALGGSTFVTPTALNPTLTMVALALRTAEHLAERASDLRARRAVG